MVWCVGGVIKAYRLVFAKVHLPWAGPLQHLGHNSQLKLQRGFNGENAFRGGKTASSQRRGNGNVVAVAVSFWLDEVWDWGKRKDINQIDTFVGDSVIRIMEEQPCSVDHTRIFLVYFASPCLYSITAFPS